MKIFHDVIKSISSHGIRDCIISKILPCCPVMSFARWWIVRTNDQNSKKHSHFLLTYLNVFPIFTYTIYSALFYYSDLVADSKIGLVAYRHTPRLYETRLSPIADHYVYRKIRLVYSRLIDKHPIMSHN